MTYGLVGLVFFAIAGAALSFARYRGLIADRAYRPLSLLAAAGIIASVAFNIWTASERQDATARVAAQQAIVQTRLDALKKRVDAVQARREALNKTATSLGTRSSAEVEAAAKESEILDREMKEIRLEIAEVQRLIDANKR